MSHMPHSDLFPENEWEYEDGWYTHRCPPAIPVLGRPDFVSCDPVGDGRGKEYAWQAWERIRTAHADQLRESLVLALRNLSYRARECEASEEIWGSTVPIPLMVNTAEHIAASVSEGLDLDACPIVEEVMVTIPLQDNNPGRFIIAALTCQDSQVEIEIVIYGEKAILAGEFSGIYARLEWSQGENPFNCATFMPEFAQHPYY